MTAWTAGPFVGYDLESTGQNPHTARIVTAAQVYATPGQRPRSIQWLVDPGCEVPDEAAAIHGWTRARILEEVGGEGMALRITPGTDTANRMRMTADGALGEIVGHLGIAMHTQTPLIIANAAYDLTLTETECARLGVDPLISRPAGIQGVVDPMVIEKAYDKYRKTCYKAPGCDHQAGIVNCTGCRGGKYRCGGCGAPDRKLGNLCLHYGLRLTAAHNAAGDALAAVRLAVKLGDLWPDVARWKLATLHDQQIPWRKEQMDSLRAYFDRTGVEHDGCDPGWPVQTALGTTPVRQDLPPAPRPGGHEHLSECAVWSDRELPCTCDDFSPEWTVA